MNSITISLIEELINDNVYIPHSAYTNHSDALDWVRKNNTMVKSLPKYRIRRVPLFGQFDHS